MHFDFFLFTFFFPFAPNGILKRQGNGLLGNTLIQNFKKMLMAQDNDHSRINVSKESIYKC